MYFILFNSWFYYLHLNRQYIYRILAYHLLLFDVVKCDNYTIQTTTILIISFDVLT